MEEVGILIVARPHPGVRGPFLMSREDDMHDTSRGAAKRTQRRAAALAAAVVATAALAGCGGGSAASDTTVTLVTHDSFVVSDEVLAAFEERSGLNVKLVQPGDGGALVNQLILSRDAPLGDAVFGIDNSFATRAIQAGVMDPYTPTGLSAQATRYQIGTGGELTPIDVSDVCVNADHTWFADHDLAEPKTLGDLTKAQYRDLLVVTNPATSSPGLAFLLATVGAFGEDGWQEYWAKLKRNGVKVASGWSDAYYTDFSGADGAGPRPLVVSYASSPAVTLAADGKSSTTGALLDTCFRQVEYAGVLKGAKNPTGARELVDFLTSAEFQADVPGSMYMYPVNPEASVPVDWARYAPLAAEPFEVDPQRIDAKRADWIEQWTATVLG